jgi:hypothetical protein
VDVITDAQDRLDRLDAQLAELVPSWSMAPVVAAYQALRGAERMSKLADAVARETSGTCQESEAVQAELARLSLQADGSCGKCSDTGPAKRTRRGSQPLSHVKWQLPAR